MKTILIIAAVVLLSVIGYDSFVNIVEKKIETSQSRHMHYARYELTVNEYRGLKDKLKARNDRSVANWTALSEAGAFIIESNCKAYQQDYVRDSTTCMEKLNDYEMPVTFDTAKYNRLAEKEIKKIKFLRWLINEK